MKNAARISARFAFRGVSFAGIAAHSLPRRRRRHSSSLSTGYREGVPRGEKALEIHELCSGLASLSRARRDTPWAVLNLLRVGPLCPPLLRVIRRREEYFLQRQTPENETIFRDYVGGQPNTSALAGGCFPPVRR